MERAKTAPAATSDPQVYDYTFTALGTPCSVHLSASSQAHADIIAALALAEVTRIEKKYSRYDPDSILSTINRQAGRCGTVQVDEETASLLDFAFACHAKSGGLFDLTAGVLRRAWDFRAPRPPDSDTVAALLPFIGMDKVRWESPRLSLSLPGMELDFGGMGKEYAVDRVATLLREQGVQSALVNLGGDLSALGSHPNGHPWMIGLPAPGTPDNQSPLTSLSDAALASSGNHERCIVWEGTRYGHILNPFTGWPAQGLTSVTVSATQCMVAGAATTIAILKEQHGIPWLASLGLPHHWVTDHGQHGGNLPLIS